MLYSAGSYQSWTDASLGTSALAMSMANVGTTELNPVAYYAQAPCSSHHSELSATSEENGYSPTNNKATDCSDPVSDQYSDMDPEPQRRKRQPVPEDKKDNKYWNLRKRNNESARRSREMERRKTEDELHKAQGAVQENIKLKQEVEVLKAEINSLRRLLKDANMTLSLWIRARQASEPVSQLPPMIRNPNMSFVFPVPSSK